MKQKIINLFLPAVAALTGCFPLRNSSASSIDNFSSSGIIYERNYDYTEITDKLILWDDALYMPINSYYVYFFSKTCSHCERMKNSIIPIIIEQQNFYACESARNHVISMDAENNVGKRDIDLTIRGYPTLIFVQQGILKLNIAGENKIIDYLNSNTL